MKVYLVSIILVFSSLCPLRAQPTNLGDNEFYLSEGILSFDQFLGLGEKSNAGEFVSFPYTYTGAAFITYRHYFTRIMALGVTIGADNQKGDLSYGPDNGPFSGYGGNSGYYKREVYTGAVEALINYRAGYKAKMYGYLGLGYTSSKETFNFFSNIPDQSYFYGTPSSLFARQNTTVDFSHVNFQLTALGVRTGGAFSVFAEFGFGYKGLVNAGFSYDFNRRPHQPERNNLEPTQPGETMLLPADFPFEDYKKVYFLSKVKSSELKHIADSGFNDALDNMISEVHRENGNVLQVITITDAFNPRRFYITGRAYTAPDYDAFRAAILAGKNEKHENGHNAFLVIFRTRNGTGTDKNKMQLNMNDSVVLNVERNVRYIYKITKEGPMTLALDSNETLQIDISFGNDYYVEAYVEPTNRQPWEQPSHLRRVDNLTGDLQSAALRHSFDMDFKRRVKKKR